MAILTTPLVYKPNACNVEKSPAYSIKIKHHRSFQMVLWSIGGGIHKITMQNHAPPTKNTLPMWKKAKWLVLRSCIHWPLLFHLFALKKKQVQSSTQSIWHISQRCQTPLQPLRDWACKWKSLSLTDICFGQANHDSGVTFAWASPKLNMTFHWNKV